MFTACVFWRMKIITTRGRRARDQPGPQAADPGMAALRRRLRRGRWGGAEPSVDGAATEVVVASGVAVSVMAVLP